MPVANSYIGQVFDHLADLLEIKGANPFRIRAYRNAARVVTSWPQSLSDIITHKEELPKLPGLGKDLTDKVKELVSTGKLSLLEDVEKEVPKELSTLLKVPSLGPKRVQLLRNQLGVRTLEDLKTAAKAGKIHEIPGFGVKTERKILQELKNASSQYIQNQRILLSIAQEIAEPLIAYLKATPGVKQTIIAGSYRRKQETVGDLDVLVTSGRSSPVMDRFIHYEEVDKIISHGPTRSTVLFRSGIQVDLRVVPEKCYGAALHYFTGSKSHNIEIRKLGVKRGLKINEYGIFRGRQRIAGKTEEEIYKTVGLPYIEPELRESRGEVEAARNHHLPHLVTTADLKGDLHAHTKATDGRLSLEEMAKAAQKIGYEYLAITDHSQHLTVARGLTPRRLREQMTEIDRINDTFKGQKFRLLKGIEVDILEDGKLDLPNEVLAELDLTVCSIHFKFELSERKQTTRILKAMDNPYFNILGHPTGRLIGQRPPYAINVETVMKAAKERGCYLEVNCQPTRTDLNDVYCILAKKLQAKVAVSTDAHNSNDLNSMRLGINQTRRGWLEGSDIINTRPWNELKMLLKRQI